MSHNTLTVYVIFDSKAEAWSKPIFSRNDATVARELREVLAQGNTVFSSHPEDHTLFKVGVWSEDKPMFEYLPAPESLYPLVQLMPKRTDYTDVNQLSAA